MTSEESKPLKDSGQRRTFETGAVRDVTTGKGRFDLLPPYAIARLARHYERGAQKYKDRNWEAGIPLHSFYDSATRHLFQFWAGRIDEDHLVAAFWNIAGLIETQHRVELGILPKSLDDRPYKTDVYSSSSEDERDLIYLAGLIDGDGSVCICKTQRKTASYLLRVQVDMTHESTIEWIGQRFGGTVRLHKANTKRPNNRDSYVWIVSQENAGKVLDDILPYLKTKKEQAMKGLKFLHATRTERDILFKEMKILNRRGVHI